MVKKYLYSVLAGICTVSMVSAEETPKQNNTETEDDAQVIVILGKVPRPIADVVGSAIVISSDMIEKQLMHNIADLVRYQAGINIENSGTRFGYSGFSIRGMGGNRVATEIDGIPVSDQFDIGSYSNSGRNFVDTELIQQVEILKGPASSIYGSDAIGGVVSFITKRPVDLLSLTDKDYYLGLKTGYYGVDNSRVVSVNSAFASDNSSALFSFSLRKGNEFANQASSALDTDYQNNNAESFLAKYFISFSENQMLIFSYDSFRRQADTQINSFIGQGRFLGTTGLTGDDESKRQNISASYEFSAAQGWLDGGVVRLYRQDSKTRQLTDETRFSRGTNFQYDRSFFYQQEVTGLRLNFYANPPTTDASHTVGYGFEWSNTTTTELRDAVQTNLDTNSSTSLILSEQFPLRDFPISDVMEVGIYVNDDISLNNSAWSIVPAIRYDYYSLSPKPDIIYLQDNQATEVVSISESSVSPKLGVVYRLSDSSKLYGQYIRGYRAPPFEDANIGLDIPLFNVRALPNPDLVSETSDGIELGYSLSDENHQLEVAIFYNDYKDFIQTKVNLGFDPVSRRVLFQSQNIERAKIAGADISYQYQSDSWFAENDHLTVNINLFVSKGTNEVTLEPLNSIEPNQALIGLRWNSPDLKWSIAFHSTLVAAKNNVDESTEELFKPAGYAIFDVISNYQINNNTSLSFAINNLADRKYWRWSDINSLAVDDPILESLSAPGINGSLQLKIHW